MTEQAVAEGIIEPEPEKPIDSGQVSQEMYDTTLAEVRFFIDNLNRTISGRNYSNWREALSDEYFEQISSPEFLATASDSPLLHSKNITLKSPNDYFVNVVVPSRNHSRVDEIEFEAANRVKAYYVDTRNAETRRLRLYELVKIDDKWKIAN